MTGLRIGFIFWLSAAAAAGCTHKAPAPPQKPKVSAAFPIVRKVVDWDDYVGRFEAIQDVVIMPRVSGTVTKVLFRNGQDVKRGDALFIIDPRPYRAAYDQASAAALRAQATVGNATTELARSEKLRGIEAVSQEEYETKAASLKTAQADVASQKAAIATAALDLEFTTVRAPIDGRVSDRRVSIGDVVNANTTQLTRVVTLDPIWFSFEGAEAFYLKYAHQARSGERGSSRDTPNPVEIQLADESGYPHRGHMVFVDNAIDTKSGTIRARAELSNADHILTPGMFGRARLLGSGAYEALLLPEESIVTDQTRRMVFVVGDGGKVAPHPVEIGPLVEGLRVIRKGITAQDRVVLDGLTRLQPGTEVDVNLVKLKPRADDTAPKSEPASAPPSSQATAE